MLPLAFLLLGAAPQPAAAPLVLAQAEEQFPFEVWNLDQLRIPPETEEAKLKALEPAHSLDAAIEILKKQGIRYERLRAVIVPDRLPEKLRADILALPEGEPFVLPENGFISISVLVSRKLPPGTVRWSPPRPLSFPSAHKA